MKSHANIRALSYAQRLSEVCLAALLFALPFDHANTIHDILFFTIFLSFLAKRMPWYGERPLKLSLPFRQLDLAILLSIVWSMVALLNAIAPEYSFHEIIHKGVKQYVLYGMTFYTISEMSDGVQKIQRVLLSLVAAALVMSLYACYQFYEVPVFFQNRVSGFTGEFYRLSVFLVLSIPMILAAAVNYRGWLRWLSLVSIPLSIAALIFTFTRSAWIAVTVEAAIFVIVLLRKYRKPLLIGAAVTLLGFILLAYSAIIPKTLIIHGSERPRVNAFFRSVEIVGENPFMGIGYGKKTFSMFYPDIYVKHTHNIFLNTAVEVGIPGLLLFIGIVFIILRRLVEALKRETARDKRVLLTGITASVIGFLSLNLFDYMYHGWPGQMFWILIGFGIALTRSSE